MRDAVGSIATDRQEVVDQFVDLLVRRVIDSDHPDADRFVARLIEGGAAMTDSTMPTHSRTVAPAPRETVPHPSSGDPARWWELVRFLLDPRVRARSLSDVPPTQERRTGPTHRARRDAGVRARRGDRSAPEPLGVERRDDDGPLPARWPRRARRHGRDPGPTGLPVGAAPPARFGRPGVHRDVQAVPDPHGPARPHPDPGARVASLHAADRRRGPPHDRGGHRAGPRRAGSERPRRPHDFVRLPGSDPDHLSTPRGPHRGSGPRLHPRATTGARARRRRALLQEDDRRGRRGHRRDHRLLHRARRHDGAPTPATTSSAGWWRPPRTATGSAPTSSSPSPPCCSPPATRPRRTSSATGSGTCTPTPPNGRRWCDEPSIRPHGVDELLRYDSPVQATQRLALEPMEIGGVAIPTGRQMTVLLGAANHDPRVHPDPDTLDLGRLAVSSAVLRVRHPPLHRCGIGTRRGRGRPRAPSPTASHASGPSIPPAPSGGAPSCSADSPNSPCI